MNKESDEKQAELFDEFAETRRRRPRNKLRLPRATITVSYENLVFGSILLLLTIVVLFTLGVEKGKRMGLGAASRLGLGVKTPIVASTTTPEVEVDTVTSTVSVSNEEATAPVQDTEPIAKETSVERYAIQLITYTNEGYARKELDKLRKQGVECFVVHSGKFFVINVGPYPNKEKALSILKEFKSQTPYQSAYLKKVTQ